MPVNSVGIIFIFHLHDMFIKVKKQLFNNSKNIPILRISRLLQKLTTVKNPM